MLALALTFTAVQEVIEPTPAAATHQTEGDETVFGVPTPGQAFIGQTFTATGGTNAKALDDAHSDLDDPHLACKREADRGAAAVTGAGLFLPDPTSPPITGAYVFKAPITSVAHGSGTIWACGSLDAAVGTGIGAACGSSSSEGIAVAQFGNPATNPDKNDPNTVIVHANYSWEATVAGTLPITGSWWDPTGTGSKGNRDGFLQGVVQAQGGAPCATTGATTFDVAGEITLIPN